jgi:hypothetical protein
MSENSSRKFKFISPGVFIKEIDNSQLPAIPSEVGPMVIGRTRKGPGMAPTVVTSMSDFVETFGNPIAGAEGGDVWRGEGVASGPTYAAYAAQAWLASNSPVTVLRLLGEESSDANTTTGVGKAGWYAGADGSKSSFAFSNVGATGGGAWGLVVWPSGAQIDTAHRTRVTGALAATLYLDEGRAWISGTLFSGSGHGGASAATSVTNVTTGSACTLFRSNTDGTITLCISKTGADPVESQDSFSKIDVSMDPSSPNFIRNVLNTNPTIVNDDITTVAAQSASQGGEYWIGESFERTLYAEGPSSLGVLSSDLGSTYTAALLPMTNLTTGATMTPQHDFLMPSQRGTTGWFIGQDLSSNTGSYSPKDQQQLFRLEALTGGEWAQNEIKVSIANIKAAKGEFELYGSFSVLVRQINDDDNRPAVIERWDNVNLNPASPNYIAVRIGDQYEEYDSITKTNTRYGRFPNNSNYVRVVMNQDLDRGGLDTRLVPFGMFGPPKYRDVSYFSGTVQDGWKALNSWPGVGVNPTASVTQLSGGLKSTFGNMGGHAASGDGHVLEIGLNWPWSGSIRFPSVPLRQKKSWATPKTNLNTYWGVWTNQTTNAAYYNRGIPDMLRPRAAAVTTYNNPSYNSLDVANATGSYAVGSTTYPTEIVELSWVFSLDNVSGTLANDVVDTARYYSGARAAGKSLSAVSTFTGTLNAGVDRFTTLLHGGFDGFDITERDPFRLEGFPTSPTEANSYQLETLKRAINIVSDPDAVAYNVISIPGVVENNTTNYLLEKTEDRSDALAVIDIQDVYTPDTENKSSDATNNGTKTIKSLVSNFEDRNINNSYGAAYAPWLLYQDTISDRIFWGPPSIAVLGTLSNTDLQDAPWFAPAGFQRGGLTEGAAGIPVLEVSRRLSATDRDDLYAVNINPIAKFPAEGIVVWGQKTLQQVPSALDRINVRRLMIFLKREISFIASRLLFGPNTEITWQNFLSEANPLLNNVKMQFGIEDFRLVLDNTTTTPDLVDRNIIYAKLLVKPTRSVEFFAIDFVILNSGAAFED